VSQHTLPNAHNCQGGLINSPHTFWATSLTIHLENGGKLEVAQNLSGQADTSTTKLYDRRKELISKEEVERIRI
jgi:site-specific recombinase XerD